MPPAGRKYRRGGKAMSEDGYKYRAKNMYRQCLVCRWLQFREEKMNAMQNLSIGQKARDREAKHFGILSDNTLRDIRMLKRTSSVWTCSKEHEKIAKEQRERFQDKIKGAEKVRESKSQAIQNAKFGLCWFVEFLRLVYGEDDPDLNTFCTKYLDKGFDHLRFMQLEMDIEYDKLLRAAREQ